MEDSGTSGNNQGMDSSRASDRSKTKIKVLCFSEGHPVFSSRDGSLQYDGGNSYLVHFRNDISYADFCKKMSSLFRMNIRRVRYYLPGHGLVNMSTDEDVENMIEEYGELNSKQGPQIFKIFLDLIDYDDPWY
ncbi:hypothetical protein FNV43_RR19712 [Rhamnella rubrinervis]|uniref:PB1 domain-containing protein n=1 Tax=Rhamnella rubrinervis TaxID=2594499 RepID=A0A8K0GSP1_9ROSA|nr:hypothetical protein FNV43_RR19712 [Rhamnella rubrinervis]